MFVMSKSRGADGKPRGESSKVVEIRRREGQPRSVPGQGAELRKAWKGTGNKWPAKPDQVGQVPKPRSRYMHPGPGGSQTVLLTRFTIWIPR